MVRTAIELPPGYRIVRWSGRKVHLKVEDGNGLSHYIKEGNPGREMEGRKYFFKDEKAAAYAWKHYKAKQAEKEQA